jgi:hypothetical protein
MYGKDYEYANSRLNETIVRRGNTPVYVYNVSVGMKVQYVPLDKVEEGPIEVCDIDELDLHPVPLGYCNYNKSAVYLSRMPMRRDWRQGLRRGNFITKGSGIDPFRIPYAALNQAILGDYPTFKGALDAVRKVKSMAWHRHWAVDNGLQVMYKGAVKPVGNVIDGEIVLDSRYMHLSEALKESL